LTEWRAFAEFEPLPDPYLVGAAIQCTIANVFRGKGRPITPREIMPWLHEPQTPEDMFKVLAGLPGVEIRGVTNGGHR
jgi:hypothetical protein